MHVETCGAGPDLVLLHGWAMHGGVFAPLAGRLREHFTLHLVDLPGHGLSHDQTTPLEPARCARELLERMPRATWLGWSFGALVAIEAGLRDASRVRGVVAMSASPRFVAAPDWPHGVPLQVFTQFEAGLRDDYRATIERFLALEAIGSRDAQAALRELKSHVFERGTPAPEALAQGLAVLETVDMRDALAALDVPSLWIAGRRDRLVPSSAMRWAAQRSGGCCIELSSGHAPFLSHPVEVADAIIAFAKPLAA